MDVVYVQDTRKCRACRYVVESSRRASRRKRLRCSTAWMAPWLRDSQNHNQLFVSGSRCKILPKQARVYLRRRPGCVRVGTATGQVLRAGGAKADVNGTGLSFWICLTLPTYLQERTRFRCRLAPQGSEPAPDRGTELRIEGFRHAGRSRSPWALTSDSASVLRGRAWRSRDGARVVPTTRRVR